VNRLHCGSIIKDRDDGMKGGGIRVDERLGDQAERHCLGPRECSASLPNACLIEHVTDAQLLQ
jgi:hypothetical protein